VIIVAHSDGGVGARWRARGNERGGDPCDPTSGPAAPCPKDAVAPTGIVTIDNHHTTQEFSAAGGPQPVCPHTGLKLAGTFVSWFRSIEDLERVMNFQGVVMNVADLDRSIDFYRDVLGFTLLSREEQLAAVSASPSDRTQVIVLRVIGRGPVEGAGHIGLQAFVLEVETADQLDRIANELDSRRLLTSRRAKREWTAVVGRDPDGVSIVVTWIGEEHTGEDRWRVLDDFLYGIGQ
jgi:catechol 2,3-dioxygenase-like lactoylglutathione lyase family enzyme